MDKTSLNYANLFGYQEALGLEGRDFNYLSASEYCYYIHCAIVHLTHNGYAVVYAGYFFGQYPCGWLIGRFPVQRVIAVSILLWGVMVLLMTQSRSYSSACRYRELIYMPVANIIQWPFDVGARHNLVESG
jgi:MFS family permease